MKATVFRAIRDLVHRESGIAIQPGKEAMVASRLGRRIRALELPDEVAYLEYLQRELEAELVELLDVISTNVTHFFREPEAFEHLARMLRQGWDAGQRRFRIWCAASSTGEEPYSIAMTAHHVLGGRTDRGRPADWRVLASDISTRVLRIAGEGVYPEAAVATVPETLRRTYVKKFHENADEARVRVADVLREHVVFKRINLAKHPFPMPGPLDAVFCRNVMIYFEQDLRTALVGEFRRLLRPGGLLLVGKSEGLTHVDRWFERCGPSSYVKRSDGGG